MAEDIFLSIPGHPRHLCLVRRAVEQIARTAGFSEKESERTGLAVNEACCNIIKYSYGGDLSGKIEINVSVSEDALTVNIRDYGEQGKKFDIDKICCPDLEKLKPGGLGINIMRTVMDRVEYLPGAEGGNVLRMMKRKG